MAAPHTLTISAPDQHRFDATVYPTTDPSAPVLIFLSALGTPSRVYARFARELVTHGVQVCAPDWRGIDSSSVRAGRARDCGDRHLVELDLASLITSVRDTFPDAPIWLGGHSLGGQLSLLGAAKEPGKIDGIVLVASGSVHLPCYAGKLKFGIRLISWLSRLSGVLLGYFPGSRLGFGGREAAGLMRDWSHVAITGAYQPKGSVFDYEQGMESLCVPVLALTFEADFWSPLPAAKALVGKLSSSQVDLRHWRASDTAGIRVDHYSWLKQPALVAPAVAAFMVSHVPAKAQGEQI